MKWFLKCIRNYVNFKGRARRSEYWYFVLFTFIFMVVCRALDYFLFRDSISEGPFVSPITSIFGLLIFLPQVAVMTRRLHDIGRSGNWVLWYYLVGIIWVVTLVGVILAASFGMAYGMVTGADITAALMQGTMSGPMLALVLTLLVGGLVFLVWAITFLVWFCTPGTKGDNKYGPDPKAVEE